MRYSIPPYSRKEKFAFIFGGNYSRRLATCHTAHRQELKYLMAFLASRKSQHAPETAARMMPGNGYSQRNPNVAGTRNTY